MFSNLMIYSFISYVVFLYDMFISLKKYCSLIKRFNCLESDYMA